ncbi:MAG: 50S ribosomal protein L10 [Candidatus Methanoperedens sp.]|jgi:large subunit ribosomal protein L10|nr:50S ribosomal protein L10 [Candidatus Methanoperedens sp.]PKL54502.1 MAG: 50S ribosomal protein L10 [Candidatus Methanoperedenaceae archaeon HGW-Methanoperedenaceae-1]
MSAEVEHHSEHIPQWKKDRIDEIKTSLISYSSVGLVGIRGIPSNQLQMMRKKLRGLADIKICRNTLLSKALEESSDDIKKMGGYIDDQTALLLSNENPFKLYRILSEGKTDAPIKGGGVASKDIVVQSGPTSFPPGPIVGELQSVGIPSAIEGGKVVIRQTKTVAKAGDVVDSKLASILTRLEIYPVELGLDLRAVIESGMIYESKILAVDETRYFNDIMSAVRSAFNLSVNAAYPTKANITTLLSKAASESRNLAINAVIMIPEVMDVLLSKANSQMLALAAIASQKDAQAIGDKLKEKLAASTVAEAEKPKAAEAKVEKKEEKKAEEEETDVAAGLGSLFG